MTVYNFTDASITGQDVPHASMPNGMGAFIRRNVVDVANQNIANDGSSAQVLNVYAGETVMACWVRVITVDAGGGTLSLGVTTTDATKWGAALAISALGIVEHADAFLPLYFSADDTIDLLEDGAAAITTAKLEVVALIVPASDTLDVNTPGISGSGD